ncbi:MAG: hypothetical protein M1419_03175 [Bacteroidetes bacterium]|nr:hypothetical protein [Bacteroidota bacterium]
MTAFVGVFLVITGIFLLESFRRLVPLIIILISSVLIIFLTDSIVKSFADVSVAELFQNRIEGIWHYGSVKSEGMEGESIYGRMNTAERSINIWKKHPINGCGIGLTAYDKEEDIYFSDFSSLTALAETGLIGFISLTGMFIALMVISGKYITNKKNFSDLTMEHRRLIGLIFYLMLHQVLINYITGNNLVKDSMWVPLGMIFSIINSTIIKQGGKVFTISLMKEPLKQTFLKALNKSMIVQEKK